MASCARYEIVYVMRDGERRSRTVVGAPPPQRLWNLRPKGNLARFVARYMPSKKAWRVYDLDKFHERQLPNGRMIVFPPPYFETSEQDAAIMAATLLCG